MRGGRWFLVVEVGGELLVQPVSFGTRRAAEEGRRKAERALRAALAAGLLPWDGVLPVRIVRL